VGAGRACRGAISLAELAGLEVFHGPLRAQPGTYDAWTQVVRQADPRFGFTDPPFGRSLAMTLAFAAAGDRPAAVLTGPATPAGGARPLRRPGRPAAAAWSGSAWPSAADRFGGPGVERRPAPPAAADALRGRRQPDSASARPARRPGLADQRLAEEPEGTSHVQVDARLAARPGIGAITLALLFGLYSLIFGVSEIVLGIELHHSGKDLHPVLSGAP
jgi:hypothetical protein